MLEPGAIMYKQAHEIVHDITKAWRSSVCIFHDIDFGRAPLFTSISGIVVLDSRLQMVARQVRRIFKTYITHLPDSENVLMTLTLDFKGPIYISILHF